MGMCMSYFLHKSATDLPANLPVTLIGYAKICFIINSQHYNSVCNETSVLCYHSQCFTSSFTINDMVPHEIFHLIPEWLNINCELLPAQNVHYKSCLTIIL